MASNEWILYVLSKRAVNGIIHNSVKDLQFNQITKRLISGRLSTTATTEWLGYVTRNEKQKT